MYVRFVFVVLRRRRRESVGELEDRILDDLYEECLQVKRSSELYSFAVMSFVVSFSVYTVPRVALFRVSPVRSGQIGA